MIKKQSSTKIKRIAIYYVVGMVVLFFLLGGHVAKDYVDAHVESNICVKEEGMPRDECDYGIEKASFMNLIPLTADIYGWTIGTHPYRLGRYTGVKPLQKEIDATISGLITTVFGLSFFVLLFFHLTWKPFWKHLFKNPYS